MRDFSPCLRLARLTLTVNVLCSNLIATHCNPECADRSIVARIGLCVGRDRCFSLNRVIVASRWPQELTPYLTEPRRSGVKTCTSRALCRSFGEQTPSSPSLLQRDCNSRHHMPSMRRRLSPFLCAAMQARSRVHALVPEPDTVGGDRDPTETGSSIPRPCRLTPHSPHISPQFASGLFDSNA